MAAQMKAALFVLLVSALALFTLSATTTYADADARDAPSSTPPPQQPNSDADMTQQLDQLRAKILSLESLLQQRSSDLLSKDQAISDLDKLLQDKSANIAALQHDVALLQQQLSAAAADKAGKSNAQTAQLQQQIDALNKEIQSQNDKRLALEAQSLAAEAKSQDLLAQLQSLQKTSEDQTKRIRKTERALKAAEEELMRAQLEASSKHKQLHEVHGAWLPPWLATQMAHYMEVMSIEWNEHGKPVLDGFFQMATEKSNQAQKWAEPHLETAKTKLIPVVQEKWVVLKTNTEPYIQLVSSKSLELYETAKIATAPHIIKFHEVTSPYVQNVKKVSKPYIDQASDLSRPHVEKLAVLTEPYRKQAITTYTSFLKSATTYHHQAQANIGEYLKRHEFTKQLATKELIWFMASALLALPFFLLYRILSQIFCVKKPRKQTRSTQGNHGARRHKRRHADK